MKKESKTPNKQATTSHSSDWNWIARVLHFSDSALPVGAYAHSFGLEGVCQLGFIKDKETLRTFLNRDVVHSLAQVDLPLVAHAHAAALQKNTALLTELEQLSFALRPTRQLREAASRIGKQQLKIYQATWARIEDSYSDLPHLQSPIILGIILAEEGAPVTAALWSLAYQTFSALLQAMLKLLPIGPSATQELLHDAMTHIQSHFDDALALNQEDIGSYNPIWDIAASRHEHAPARLFIS